jgi:sugar phosphate isomerase/epimerase
MHSPGIDRRALLALLGAAAVSGEAMAAPQPFFARHKLPIGIQLYTLGPDAQKDLAGTLKAIAEIGYRDIELAGFYGKTPAEMKAALDAAGLKCSSAHIQGRGNGSDPTFSGDLGKLADAMHVIGAKTVVMPSTYIPDRLEQRPAASEEVGAWLRRVLSQLTADDWKMNADFLNDKARKLETAGLRVGYHNHNTEFLPLKDAKGAETNGLEILLRNTDPKLVTFEMDIGWVAAAGVDPLKLLKQHKRRFTQVHVKDIKADTRPNFDLRMDPTEIGSGVLKWNKLLPAAYAAGVRSFFVEQEPPFARPRIEAAKISHDFLASVKA